MILDWISLLTKFPFRFKTLFGHKFHVRQEIFGDQKVFRRQIKGSSLKTFWIQIFAPKYFLGPNIFSIEGLKDYI